jgi:diguanylate cyclase (GGDEF)-like protein
MDRTVRISLSIRLSLLIFVVTLGLGAALTFTGYSLYRKNMEARYVSMGLGLTATAATLLKGEDMERYLAELSPVETGVPVETGAVGDAYNETMRLLINLFTHNRIDSLYVVQFIPEGSRYMFDISEQEPAPPGFFDPWNEGFPDEEKLPFLEGRDIPPEIYDSNQAGMVLTVHTPIRYADGSVAKGWYVAADFSMDTLSREYREYFIYFSVISLGMALGFALIHWYIVHHSVVLPVYTMAKASREFLIANEHGEDQRTNLRDLAALSVHTGDELQVLAESLQDLEKKIWAYIKNLNEANHKAAIDSLTGLHNRETLYNNVNLFIHRFRNPEQYHAFWILDIDRFKHINDTYGHAAGDEALKGCAAALSKVFRLSDEVARIGGDEFAIFSSGVRNPGIVEQKAIQVKTAIAAIRQPGWAEGITVSIGIALFSDADITYDDLFQRADTALYAVKARGRDGYQIERL